MGLKGLIRLMGLIGLQPLTITPSFFFSSLPLFFLFITNFVQSKPILTYDCNPKTIDAYRNYSFFKRSICHWRNGRKSYKVR